MDHFQIQQGGVILNVRHLCVLLTDSNLVIVKMNTKNYNSAMVQKALKILKEKGMKIPTMKQITHRRPFDRKVILELFKTLRKENG